MTDPELVAKKLAFIEFGRLEQMAGFRNVVVHIYQDVDLASCTTWSRTTWATCSSS